MAPSWPLLLLLAAAVRDGDVRQVRLVNGTNQSEGNGSKGNGTGSFEKAAENSKQIDQKAMSSCYKQRGLRCASGRLSLHFGPQTPGERCESGHGPRASDVSERRQGLWQVRRPLEEAGEDAGRGSEPHSSPVSGHQGWFFNVFQAMMGANTHVEARTSPISTYFNRVIHETLVSSTHSCRFQVL